MTAVGVHEWARWYAQQGWPVFPLQPRSKLPYPATRGFHEAINDVDVVDRWWAERPASNIGLATGRLFDVVDLDRDDGTGNFDAWWLENVPDRSPNLRAMLIVGTPGGGQHWYVEPIPGATNRAGMLAHVDYRANGYVVAPPSVHPNGGAYQWLNPPNEGVLLKLPQSLVDLVLRRSSSTESQVVRQVAVLDPGRGDGTRYGIGAVRRACERVAAAVQGTRNDVLNREALGLYQLVAGGEINEAFVEECLTDAARCSGLGAREVAATLRSARNAGMSRPRRAS